MAEGKVDDEKENITQNNIHSDFKIDIGCSYAFLSPVIRKNGIDGMGWDSFFVLKDKYPQITIVPLGGINESNAIVEAFAGISHWWNHQA